MARVRAGAKAKKVKSYQLQQKRRRSRALLTQACLGVMIVALLFGISYACIQIVHGQPVLPVAVTDAIGGAAPGSAPESVSVPVQSASAPQADAVPSGAQTVNGQEQPQAPVQVWNTAVPLERTLLADLSAADARMIAVPENGRLSVCRRVYNRDVGALGPLVRGEARRSFRFEETGLCWRETCCPAQLFQNQFLIHRLRPIGRGWWRRCACCPRWRGRGCCG